MPRIVCLNFFNYGIIIPYFKSIGSNLALGLGILVVCTVCVSECTLLLFHLLQEMCFLLPYFASGVMLLVFFLNGFGLVLRLFVYLFLLVLASSVPKMFPLTFLFELNYFGFNLMLFDLVFVFKLILVCDFLYYFP